MIAYESRLGDIVAVKSHPYFQEYTQTIIAGDHLLTPPLMVVAEILKDTKTQFNEKTGEEESRVGFSQCKCIWYSQKTNQFEEAWITSKLLKIIYRNEDDDQKDTNFFDLVTLNENKQNEPKFKKYHSVILKTNQLELSKKKSSINVDESSSLENNEEKYTINSYLAFVGPVMEIVQIFNSNDVEQKDVKFNSRSGEKRKIVSDWMVKVKWFNANSDKFSEKVLPLCVLEVIKPINEIVLEQIKEAIINMKYFRFFQNDLETIVKPKELLYKNGYYFLYAYDYLMNRNKSFLMSENFLNEESKYYIDKFPKFEYINSGIYSDNSVIEEIIQAITIAKNSKNFIRIKYKNRNEKLSMRTIKEYEVKPVNDGSAHYLVGYCMSCKDQRTFNISKIQKIELLDIKF